MAQSWYLLATPHDQVSGYESEGFDDFAQEGFLEALDSSIGVEVELYNYDLSVQSTIRAVVDGKLQETKLNAMTRRILTPIGTVKAGMYVKYKNRFWIIVGITDDNGVYEKSVMMICTHLLTWLNSNGEVVQRWAYIESASQYNNGEYSTKYYTYRTDQLLIIIPDDEESIMLSNTNRFVIDKRCEIYEKNILDDVDFDFSNPVITYRLTRSDSVLYNYQDSGHFEFLAYQDEQHEKDGYYRINGKGYWLCESNTEIKEDIGRLEIECDEPIVYCGLDATIFTAKFYDNEGNDVNITPVWKIDSDFMSLLSIEYVEDSIMISTNSRSLIGKKFTIILSGDGYNDLSLEVMISAFI